MALITNQQGLLYRPFSFQLEKEFEAQVVVLADQLFGPNTIYVDVKKKLKGNNIISIPDGYVIDMSDCASPRLFIIENEIVTHDIFKHIGIQLLKFITSFDDAKLDVRNYLMAEITRNKSLLERLESKSHEAGSRNIDNYLDQAVYGFFRGIVVIDEAKPELHKVLEKINANISVLELKTYQADDGSRLFEFDTLYDEYEDDYTRVSELKLHAVSTPEDRAVRNARLASVDTVIVPAREEGFQRVFLGENQWYAIRIGAGMKDRLKYIAAYQVSPVSAVTHIAEIQEIKHYQDTGKYLVIFKGPAEAIKQIPIKEPKNSPQSPVYVKRDSLLQAKYLEAAFINKDKSRTFHSTKTPN